MRVVSMEGICSREIERCVQIQKKKKKNEEAQWVCFDNWLEMKCELAKESMMTSGTSG